MLFSKLLGDVDAFPLCVRSKDVDEIVNTVALLAGSFGGVNLEDISAPRCFEIERKLKERCDIPIFHDDQHGTAVVTAAALINALKLTGRKLEDVRVVTSGAGAAGIAIIKLLVSLGLKEVSYCNRTGAIYEGRDGLNAEKVEMAKITNRDEKKRVLWLKCWWALMSSLVRLCSGTVTPEMVKTMAPNPIFSSPWQIRFRKLCRIWRKKQVLPLLVPAAAIFPTGLNNVLAFPGIFRGALDVRAKDINDEMKVAAAYAIANLIDEKDLNADYLFRILSTSGLPRLLLKLLLKLLRKPA